MKRKRMVKLIDEAGIIMESMAAVTAVDQVTGETDKDTMFVSKDEIRAMQSCMVVLRDMIDGRRFTNGMNLAMSIVLVHGMTKMDDDKLDEFLAKLGEEDAETPSEDGGADDE